MGNDGRVHERVQVKVGNEVNGACHPNMPPDFLPLPAKENPAGGNQEI